MEELRQAVDPADWSDSSPRHENWADIELLLEHVAHKAKPAQKSLKRYFESGALPNWEKAHRGRYADDPDRRHLDIFSFLWLHPRQDPESLSKLKQAYLSSAEPENADLAAGIGLGLQLGIGHAAENCELMFPPDSGHPKAWLRTLPVVPDPRPAFRALIVHDESFEMQLAGERKPYLPNLGLPLPNRWLMWENINSASESSCFLIDPEIVEAMRLRACHDLKRSCVRIRVSSKADEKQFLRILRYCEERESSGVRADYARLMCDMLDNREWPAPVKELWATVCAPGFSIPDLWKL